MWPALRSGRFTLGTNPDIRCIGGWAGSKNRSGRFGEQNFFVSVGIRATASSLFLPQYTNCVTLVVRLISDTKLSHNDFLLLIIQRISHDLSSHGAVRTVNAM